MATTSGLRVQLRAIRHPSLESLGPKYRWLVPQPGGEAGCLKSPPSCLRRQVTAAGAHHVHQRIVGMFFFFT